MTKEEAKEFGLSLLHGIMLRNESYPVYANNVKQAIDALSEENSNSEKPIDIDFEQELYKHFGLVKDFTLGMRIGQYFYNLCKEQMMKEAVEGHIVNAGGEFGYDIAAVPFSDNHTSTIFLQHEFGRKYGDKVRVIVLPKED